MAQQSRSDLETYFQTGDIPTQAQFKDLLDSVPIFKKYTALMSQAGLAAPTAQILENTIGAIVWTRNSAGNYTGTLAGAFLVNKLFTIVSASQNDALFSLGRIDNNSIFLSSEVTAGSGILTDDTLNSTPVEIRVYY